MHEGITTCYFSVTLICGKKYTVNKEIFNVGNLLFINQIMLSKSERVPSNLQVLGTLIDNEKLFTYP